MPAVADTPRPRAGQRQTAGAARAERLRARCAAPVRGGGDAHPPHHPGPGARELRRLTIAGMADQLRAFMVRHGLTQARLAELLGVGRVTLNRWVNGE